MIHSPVSMADPAANPLSARLGIHQELGSEQIGHDGKGTGREALEKAKDASHIRRDDVDLQTVVDQTVGACYHKLLSPPATDP
jgi:hypothetical protein